MRILRIIIHLEFSHALLAIGRTNSLRQFNWINWLYGIRPRNFESMADILFDTIYIDTIEI